jgi:DNA replication and repair protein RecF
MRLRHLSLGGLRVFAEADFFPGSGISWICGSNGAGKTTVLESLFLLSHARSFRATQIESVLREGADRGFVFSEWVGAEGVARRIGVARDRAGGWEYRLDGERVGRVLELAERAPMLCFEPGSHLLVSGPAERRRRLLDWGVFHVERMPVSLWTAWQRVLKQRNELLRHRADDQLDAFDAVLVPIGERLDETRRLFAARWLERCSRVLAWLSPGLAAVDLEYRPGWGRGHSSFSKALLATRLRDLTAGYTGSGPHRADIQMRQGGVEVRDRLSRGQSKILALSLVLALAELFREVHGVLPLLLLDDLCSELDASHAQSVLEYLRRHGAQALVTGVDRPDWAKATEEVVFHVERGAITPLL